MRLDTAAATRDDDGMRLNRADAQRIRQEVLNTAGASAQVRLFGSRVDDAARGGDVDLLVEMPQAVERPALLCALLSARISRALHGRRVDVLLAAPNLARLPIHRHAQAESIPL